MTGAEKSEMQLKKAKEDLIAIQKKKADILEKEKRALKKVEEAENNHILKIVSLYKIDGTDLKKKLDSLFNKNEGKPFNRINDERKNKNEENI